MKSLLNVSLEITPKPFFEIGDDFVVPLMTEFFRRWRPLADRAERVSLLWWFGDGTEILEYDGNAARPVEWAMWVGFATRVYGVSIEDDPNRETIYAQPRLYRPNPAPMTYADIRRLVSLFRAAAREALGRPLRVGCAFDPGAEFCRSPFRYDRHPELLIGEHMRCIDATARLHADAAAFAGFDGGGVPEGTPFGEFLGRQTAAYARDMGFDYIWFSNSFGFGRSPYSSGGAGEFFDGERFRPEGNRAVRDAVVEFWRLFRRHCPDLEVECRGTDFTAGINLVGKATPYADLYAGDFRFTPPPNTPWPRITGNHGLAIAGYLSQICGYRGDVFPFRQYVSDPWFCNSPWRDYYERSPHEIYLTTACVRVDPDGRARAFNDVKFLTLDTTWGELPEDFAVEIIPHIERAIRFRPDAPPPVVWVYPFHEYHRYTFDETNRMPEPLAGDLLIQQAINVGLPLSGVIATDALGTVRAGALDAAVLVSPVPDAGSSWERALTAHLDRGGAALLYGPTRHAGDALRERLNLRPAAPISGDLDIAVAENPDRFREGRYAAACRHHPALSAGEIEEVLRSENDPATHILATVARPGTTERRVVALWRSDRGGGRVAWVRGTSSVSPAEVQGRRLCPHNPGEWYPAENLLRYALAALGWNLAIEGARPARFPGHWMLSRCRNGFVFAGHSEDDEAVFRIRTPLGAPLLPGRTTRIEDGAARIPVWRCFHEDVRVFVEQPSGEVSLHEMAAVLGRFRRRWVLRGLERAIVRIFPETGCWKRTEALLNPKLNHCTIGQPYEGGWKEGPWGRWLEMRHVTGVVTFAQAPDDAVQPALPPD